MKEMTQADELAILREMLITHKNRSCLLHDVNISWMNPRFEARHTESDFHYDTIAEVDSTTYKEWPTAMAACIFIARQRLATEAEAAMSPRERRLEEFANWAIDICGTLYNNAFRNNLHQKATNALRRDSP